MCHIDNNDNNIELFKRMKTSTIKNIAVIYVCPVNVCRHLLIHFIFTWDINFILTDPMMLILALKSNWN